MDLEDIMCGGRVTEGQMLFNSTLHEVSRLVIFIKLESTMVVARGWWERGIMFNRYRVSFWQDVLKVMVWWLHWIVHFTMVKMVDLGCPWGSSGAPREEGMGSSLAQKLKIPHSSWCSQTEKERKSSTHRPLLSDRTTWSQFIYILRDMWCFERIRARNSKLSVFRSPLQLQTQCVTIPSHWGDGALGNGEVMI